MKTKLFCKVTRIIAIVIACQVLSIGAIWAEPTGEQETCGASVEETAQGEETHGSDWSTYKDFGISVGASLTAAIMALLLFFGVLRPRIKISSTLACHEPAKKYKEKYIKECEILVQNKSLFSCNDLRAEISIDLLSEDDDETTYIISEQNFLALGSRLGDENNSDAILEFGIPLIKDADGVNLMPRNIKIELLAQHALSGIVLPKRKTFTISDFKEGRFIKSLFVNKGDAYDHILMKKNAKVLKHTLFTLAGIWLIISGVLFKWAPVSHKGAGVIIAILFFAMLLSVIVWQFMIHTKAKAYSKNNISHINATIIRFSQQQIINKAEKDNEQSKNAEEIPYEEVNDNDKKHLK